MDLGQQVVGPDGGVYAWTEISGDFSHLPLHDQPPKHVWKILKEGRRLHTDRTERRLPIPQLYPGKSILTIHAQHSGPVAILFNGHSLAGHDLHKITIPTIGMNRTYVGHKTYKGPDTDYLCIMDRSWLSVPQIRNHPGLLNGTSDTRELGVRPPRSWRMNPFSFDLWRDGYVSPTTGHMALQIAIWMGFKDLYCLGLDFGGEHYDGTPSGGNMVAQKKLTIEAAPMIKSRGVNVWSCGNHDGLFPYAPFTAVTETIPHSSTRG